MKLEELSIFKASVENNLGYNIENTLISKYSYQCSDGIA
ncbi:hypothetical protein BSPWISOXPB_11013 [uncultured Gammaproteobacteria bacterium]|nr:hypothetical protein BSPWISOXPB_11013 [uncultured Gammaproteobacteria bacterium]